MADGSQTSSGRRRFNTSLTDYSIDAAESTGPYARDLDIDAVIVGAGFAGIFMLKTLRDAGIKAVIFEAGDDIGGTWRWNCYPGAGVDSEVPSYEFSWPEVYSTWNWTTNYPDYKELRRYFDHVDAVVGIKKDCSFNTVVVGAQFDTDGGQWSIQTADGRTVLAKYLILATGFASKRYIPPWPGIDTFKGIIHHSSFWPDEGTIDVSGKKCAIIGTGASGVQITQAWGPKAKSLDVFQRTPNLALPMRKRALTISEQECNKRLYKDLFRLREKTFAGFLYDLHERRGLEDTPESREAYFTDLWTDGGFRFWVGSYKDLFLDARTNNEAYKFWASQTRHRISDPATRDLLAPEVMPHYFGIKRPCLEDDYFEQFNRESVNLVDIRENPIKSFTETGITLEDGSHHEFDVIALATGFDIVTGAMTQLGLKSIHGTELEKEWESGAKSYLGLTMQADGVKYMNAKVQAADKWKQFVVDACDNSLFPTTRSTYMGGSIPAKVYEPVCFVGGTAVYAAEIRKVLDDMESGFDLAKL
ncbi:hypothetical protein V2A60_009504 [Cordyceps javanica]